LKAFFISERENTVNFNQRRPQVGGSPRADFFNAKGTYPWAQARNPQPLAADHAVPMGLKADVHIADHS
jgi:hypothetical protein